METKANPLKLNYKRTFIIGFAFFGILLFTQVYDLWCPTFLTELFCKAFNTTKETDVQYLVGVMMAFDNIAALALMPIFGKLSDKTNTRIGKRMPFILIGTFVCAVAFPFIPVLVHFNSIAGVIALMAIVVFFAMMYRNPAVALMPDLTPKPLRSKANGIINIMGYIGGGIASVVGIFFVVSDYFGKTGKHPWQVGNIWTIEIPFLFASALMVISALVLFFLVKENKIKEEIKDDLARGEMEAEVIEKVSEDGPLSKGNKTTLLLILFAEFFWYMADNAVTTFMTNYTIYHLGVSSGTSLINTVIMGVGSVLGFVLGGIIAERIGRKWTLFLGLGLTLACYVAWGVLGFIIPPNGKFPIYLFVIFFIKGFGMSLVHVNSFPMVVELCSSKKVGTFTGYYYLSSMLAQSVTPILLGLLLLVPGLDWKFLPIYVGGCTLVSALIFIFVKNAKVGHLGVKKGLAAFDQDD